MSSHQFAKMILEKPDVPIAIAGTAVPGRYHPELELATWVSLGPDSPPSTPQSRMTILPGAKEPAI